MTKLKLAYFSPLNPIQSGISDYSEELLPFLARYAELDLYTDDYIPTNKTLCQSFAVYKAKDFRRQAGRYDTYLFHMGNSAAHAYIYKSLKKTSGQGILVLHDFVLHHFLIGEYLNHGKAAEYVAQMKRHYGLQGEQIAREVIKGKLAEVLFDYPLNEEAIEAARGVLVHSQYAKRLIQQVYPTKSVGIARMGVPLPPVVSKIEARIRMNLPLDEFIIVSLGHLNPYKRLDSVLWAYRAFRREYPKSRLILVGSSSPNYNVQAMITALGLNSNVTLTGYVSMEHSQDYLAAADCCVNLRYPSAGETSASLLRIMGAGRPVMISRTGAFEELPNESCIKVDIDGLEEELILEYLRLLASKPQVGQALGFNARNHVAVNARLADAAHDYYVYLCQVLGREPTISRLVNEIEEVPVQYEPDPLFQPSVIAKPAPTLSPIPEIVEAISDIGLVESDPVLFEILKAARFSGLINEENNV